MHEDFLADIPFKQLLVRAIDRDISSLNGMYNSYDASSSIRPRGTRPNAVRDRDHFAIHTEVTFTGGVELTKRSRCER